MNDKLVQSNVKKLERLRELLKKNTHVWWKAIDSNKAPSFRMYTWVDDYNDLKGKPGWKEYCANHVSHVDHEAIDLFA